MAETRPTSTADADETRPTGSSLRVETRSIDWIPDEERHGKIWYQGPLWFPGNFQYFTIAVGFVGPSLGLPLGPTIVAGVLDIAVGTLFMAFHASQGPVLGLPQMIQSRAQLGYRGVVLALIATLFTYVAFNVADQVLLAEGLNGIFDWSQTAVAVGSALIAVVLAVFGHDWLHRVFRWLLYVSLPLMTLLSLGVLTGQAGGLRPAAAARLQLGRVLRPVLGGCRVQHHVRAVCLGLLALSAPDVLPARPHRVRLLRSLRLGRLADRARRLAGHPAGGERRAGGAAAGGRPLRAGPRRGHGGALRAEPHRDDGHERVRRHAHRADRHRLVPAHRPGPARQGRHRARSGRGLVHRRLADLHRGPSTPSSRRSR